MNSLRRCSRSACGRPAVATLTYVYADQTAVVGPLATYAEPHAYDLCAFHSERLSAPRGWQVLRMACDPADVAPSEDDLSALADLVREAARPDPAEQERVVGSVPAQRRAATGWDGREGSAPGRAPGSAPGREQGRRGHLRVLPTE